MELLVCRRLVYNPMSRGVGLNLPGGPSTNYQTYRDLSVLFASSFKKYLSYRVGAYLSNCDLLFFHFFHYVEVIHVLFLRQFTLLAYIIY